MRSRIAGALLATTALVVCGGAYYPNQPVVTATGTTQPRTLSTRFADTISWDDYVLSGDGNTDDTVGANVIMTAVRTLIAALPSPGGAKTGSLHTSCRSGAVYKLTGTVDGTGINAYPQLVPVTFDFAGCAFNVAFDADNAGKSVLDFMGDGYLTINDLNIWVSTLTNLPSTGIQVGRVTCSAPGTCTPSYHHKINRPVIRGRYTVAAAYLRSSELTTITDPDIVNSYTTSGYGIAFDGVNHLGASIVTAATDQAAIDTAMPQNDDVVRGGHVSAAAGAPFFVANVYRLTLDGTYGLSQNPSTPTECLRLYAGVGEIDLLDARLHCEPNLALTTLPNSIVVEGSLSKPTPTLKGIKLEDQFAFATSSLIGLDASVTSGTIYDLVVKVPNFNTGAAKVFTTTDAGNLTLIDPVVEVPATGNWTRPATQWGGRICAGSTSVPCSLGTSGFTTNSGAGKVIIGDVGAGGGYAGINLSGTSAAGDYNFISAPGDQSLYINRHSGSSIHFREGGGADQMTLNPGGFVSFSGYVYGLVPSLGGL